MRSFTIILILAIVAAIGISGCAPTTGPGRKPLNLTNKQKSDLIDYVRFSIIRNKRIASPQEKEYIKLVPPEFRYSVDTHGNDIVIVAWKLNEKSIKAKGEGILFTPNMDWRVSVVKKSKVVKLKSKEDVERIKNQDQREIFNDFRPLLTK